MISSRAALLRGLACCVPSLLPRDAIAWCGDPFPPYAYSLPWFEFDAGPSKLPLRIVGDLKAEREQNMLPLLVLPSPGLSYEYLENLEALTISQRRVAFADLRTGAAAPDALVARILDAVAALESPGGVHLLGYGYGAALALRVYSSSAVSSGAVCGYDSEPACPATLCGSCCNPMWPMLLSYVVQVRVASLILASPLGTLDDAEPARREELANERPRLHRLGARQAPRPAHRRPARRRAGGRDAGCGAAGRADHGHTRRAGRVFGGDGAGGRPRRPGRKAVRVSGQLPARGRPRAFRGGGAELHGQRRRHCEPACGDGFG